MDVQHNANENGFMVLQGKFTTYHITERKTILQLILYLRRIN